MQCFETIDPAFGEILAADSAIRLIADGFTFTEGPAWHAGEQALYFSDIPGDTIYRWSEEGGCCEFRKPSRHANGNTIDAAGRLLTCEHASRTLTRTQTDADGTCETLAATFEGRPLNSPNDVVVDADGAIWFTDPPYGIRPENSEQPANFVFRLNEGAAEPVAVLGELPRPNGLCFTPDGSMLYVANSDVDAHNIWRYPVLADKTLGGGELFAVIDAGVPDGMRFDTEGRLFSTAADGVHVFDADGTLLGKIRTPKTAANCTFGGPDKQTLFITATDSVWAVGLDAVGAANT